MVDLDLSLSILFLEMLLSNRAEDRRGVFCITENPLSRILLKKGF
jgi:hypothetical protein